MDGTRKPYEGPEPYIFVSYARKDMDMVLPLLDALFEAGYRIWYDIDGIQAGARWTDTLVEHVENCGVFCPLFSVAFNESRFCNEETDYAYRKNKPIVPVYLEEMNADSLRPLYRLLGSRQDLRLYQYADAAAFAARLGEEEAFTPCGTPEWNKIGEIQWRLDSDGVLTIARNDDIPNYYYKTGSIPAYQYDPVNACSVAPWIKYREKIVSVVIHDTIRKIGKNAFYGCSSLATANIPDRVTIIDGWAFCECERLITMHIGNGVTTIGEGAFRGCANLTEVHIPDSVTTIGKSAFRMCSNLKHVEIPAGANVEPEAFDEHTTVIRRGT